MKSTIILNLIIMLIEFSNANDSLCSRDQVFLNGECRNYVNFHNKCSSTVMCRTKNAICLDENNKEHNYNANLLDIEREAYCQCPFRYEFSAQKDECLNYRKKCDTNSTCEINYFCYEGRCKCLYEDNKEKYYTLCLHHDSNIITNCLRDPIKPSCLNQTRYEIADPFIMNNQTWWKLSFLTVFLILIVILIKGVVRARRNEDYITWAHTIALMRNATETAHRSDRDVSSNSTVCDMPPCYADAVKQIQTDRQTTAI